MCALPGAPLEGDLARLLLCAADCSISAAGMHYQTPQFMQRGSIMNHAVAMLVLVKTCSSSVLRACINKPQLCVVESVAEPSKMVASSQNDLSGVFS